MSDQSTAETYQCEQCGTEIDDPATTESYRGYRGIVTLVFCEGCTTAGGDSYAG